MISTLLSSKIAGAIACAAIGVTGAAGAAYANVLPRPIQDIAHNTIGAPPTHSDPARHSVSGSDDHVVLASTSPSPSSSSSSSLIASTASPSASASAAAARLCDEWSDAAEGNTDDNATNVHDQLAVLAGGAGNIATFCATVEADRSEHHSVTPSPTASTSAGDEQGDDQGDDRGRDGASASPAQDSNRGPDRSASPSRTPGSGDGDNANDGPDNNNGSNATEGPANGSTNGAGSTNGDGRGGNDGSGNSNDG